VRLKNENLIYPAHIVIETRLAVKLNNSSTVDTVFYLWCKFSSAKIQTVWPYANTFMHLNFVNNLSICNL